MTEKLEVRSLCEGVFSFLFNFAQDAGKGLTGKNGKAACIFKRL